MKILKAIAGLGMAMIASAALAAQAADPAKADLKDASGRTIGTVKLTEMTDGIIISLDLTAAPAGVHAFHIHTTGKCEAPFTSAGGHFNPTLKQHGSENPKGMHAGDLLNFVVPASGVLQVDLLADGVTLAPGVKSLLDADGSALVMHALADDYHTDPTGNAGDRIACGVITR